MKICRAGGPEGPGLETTGLENLKERLKKNLLRDFCSSVGYNMRGQ